MIRKFLKDGLYTPQTRLPSVTPQNKPIYTVTLGVHNRRFVTRNKGEPVQVENDLKKRFFFLFSGAIKTSTEASSQSPICISTGRELKDWGYGMKLFQVPWVSTTNYGTWEKPNQKVWRVPWQPVWVRLSTRGLEGSAQDTKISYSQIQYLGRQRE